MRTVGLSALARWRLPVIAALCAVLGTVVATGLVWQSSTAAFTKRATNTGNVFTAATVNISNERSGQAIIAVTGLNPGDSLTRCVTVTYTSSVAATVKLYARTYTDTGGLGAFLTITANEGHTGTYGNCGTFVSTATIANAEALPTFGARTGHSTGVGTWSPTGTATISYRIRIDFPSTGSDANAQNKYTDLALGWAASST